MIDSSNPSRRSSAPNFSMHYSVPRKHFVTTPSSEVAESYCPPPEDYIGRSLPSNLPEFFKVSAYSYTGSWADNFVEFAEANNMQLFDKTYKHVKERCIYCKIKLSNGGLLHVHL